MKKVIAFALVAVMILSIAASAGASMYAPNSFVKEKIAPFLGIWYGHFSYGEGKDLYM